MSSMSLLSQWEGNIDVWNEDRLALESHPLKKFPLNNSPVLAPLTNSYARLVFKRGLVSLQYEGGE